MNATPANLVRLLLTLTLSVVVAAIATASIVTYEESQTAKQAAARTQTLFSPSQKMNPEDRALTQKIRHSLHSDKSLSRLALNIRILSRNGKVALSGPVRSQQEKISVDSKAIAVAGVDNVANELTIIPAN